MGDQLKVDVDGIRATARQIDRVRTELSSSKRLVDSYADAIGTPILADQLDAFATNWSIHREKICSSLQAFSGWAVQAADAYDGTEASLTRALRVPVKAAAVRGPARAGA